jgi:ABC-type polysaccharide/polyol phosphate export permease
MTQAFYAHDQQGRVLRMVPDVIRSRGLLYDLFWKDLRAKYRRAVIGLLWAVLQPVLMMLILTFVFGYLLRDLMGGRIGGAEHSYAVFLLAGLVPWQFLVVGLTGATNSIVANQDLIKKVYFPRETVPLAAILYSVLNFAIGFVTFLVVFSVLEGPGSLGAGVVFAPVVFAVQLALITGLGLICSALNVLYRDVAYMVEVALAFGFYATPIIYDLPRDLPPWLYRVYMLNPMAHLVEAYRQALLMNRFPDPAHLLWPLAAAAVALVLGAWVFRRTAPTFADHV